MRTTTTFALILATSLAACGGDDGTVSAIDARRIDGSGGPDAAGACDIPAGLSLGEGTGIDFERSDGTMPAGQYTLSTGITLGMDMPPTVMFLEFYNDYAPFGNSTTPGAIAPGTYTINAAQADYATCGACLRIYTKVEQVGMMLNVSQKYMPNGGTITINSITPTVGGAIDVTLSNLTMRQVDIAAAPSFATTDVPGGCTSTIADAHFTGMVVAPMKQRGNAVTYMLVPSERKH